MGTRADRAIAVVDRDADLPTSPGHPFYARLNAMLDAHGFDRFVERQCAEFYADGMGRPSLTPGHLFPAVAGRLLRRASTRNAGSRGARPIRWRSAVSCGLALDEAAPDHSTISRTRRLIDLETHRAVFTWVQQRLVEVGLAQGQERSRSTRRRWRPTPRCAASCGATPGRAIRSF